LTVSSSRTRSIRWNCIVNEVAALRRLSIGQLRLRFAELFGEATYASNRTWLTKRILWRMQALAQGDLSQRAAELARDADLRLNAPHHKATTTTPSPQLANIAAPIDPRLPPPGTILTRPYKDQLIRVQVLTEGFAYAGRIYPSLSAVAKTITGSHTNGSGWCIRQRKYGPRQAETKGKRTVFLAWIAATAQAALELPWGLSSP
jgi:hypothetical protein